ncbi:HAD-IB family phosphatase [Verrucomicrobiaceae bacterium R5-34]|uniref:phosphoserine phosphatase n=1 Tax=Oceaniferula flava TaxID=2800421 RepID=A0AAE2SFE8_9BACT|nr:HAD-IB family phosphatase [Oceaniferula flavus]MBK1830734.1 HAD-IB family phosphatase [Verrucomicrobiaceae bacterium R5-34]MBK1855992.1 HAD-IB family phosphatase [Oceaniferula flavus]MBM1137299.1 HAD-IB family phosphatase [Oceaniferula flavus]
MKLIVFDCDSTLSAIEGIDELARLRGDDTFAEIEALTNAAMDGEVPIDEIFARRLDIIQPSRDFVDKVGQLYIEHIEPTAKATIKQLRAEGWEIVIVSGGFTQVIEPLAAELGIERIEAVPLKFNADGSYAGFDADAPPTRNGGKPELIAGFKKEMNPERSVMVGDGISDLETQSEVDLFIGFTRYAARDKVVQEAAHCVDSLDQIPSLLA